MTYDELLEKCEKLCNLEDAHRIKLAEVELCKAKGEQIRKPLERCLEKITQLLKTSERILEII